jgi:predicted amidohydrolase
MIKKNILVLLFAITISGMSLFAQGESKMVDKKSFKLALIQMKVEGGNRAANLAHAQEMIDDACGNGAQVLLLPEAMDLGWTHPSALTDALPVPQGETCQFLIRQAKKHAVYICSGLIEKEKERVYNTAVLIDPEGRVILKHRKIYELDIGHPYYAVGERLNVVETDLGTIGVLICADANTINQVLTRSLCYMGADVILSPCSWAVEAEHNNTEDPYGALWENAYATVAKDFAVWIAGCSNVGRMNDGPWKDWKGIGCSLVINSEGNIALKGPYGEEADTVLYIDIQPMARPAQGTDWPGYWQKVRD